MIMRCRYDKLRFVIAFVLLVYANACFYRLDTIIIYLIMNIIAGAIVFFSCGIAKIRVSRYLKWLTCLFVLYCVYGVLFLRTGTFNIDRFILSYYQCILYYIIIITFIDSQESDRLMALSCGAICFLNIITTRVIEGNLFTRESRLDGVGGLVAGNVNTFGVCLGIMTLFITFYYARSRKVYILLFDVAVMIVMLLTASKKTLLYIVADIGIIYFYTKNKTYRNLMMVFLVAAMSYIVFGTEYFYDLIGARVIDMLGQMGFKVSNAHYSYSTAVRIDMMIEAIELWLKHPVFGGGTYYFWANTSSGYEYSHCNITELLCSFGMVGFLLFYSQYFYCYRNRKKIKRWIKDYYYFNMIILVMTIVIEWAMVTYSGMSFLYIPIIWISAITEKSKVISCQSTFANRVLDGIVSGEVQNE